MPRREGYEYQDDQEIVEQTNYLNIILLPAIRDIDEAIKNGKDGLDCAENLISDIIWDDDLNGEVEKQRKILNEVLEEQGRFLLRGILGSQQLIAKQQIENAKKEYSKNIKHIGLILIHKKIGLFKTRRKIDRGFKKYKELDGATEDEDADD